MRRRDKRPCAARGYKDSGYLTLRIFGGYG
jgi:hypothetical protein